MPTRRCVEATGGYNKQRGAVPKLTRAFKPLTLQALDKIVAAMYGDGTVASVQQPPAATTTAVAAVAATTSATPGTDGAGAGGGGGAGGGAGAGAGAGPNTGVSASTAAPGATSAAAPASAAAKVYNYPDDMDYNGWLYDGSGFSISDVRAVSCHYHCHNNARPRPLAHGVRRPLACKNTQMLGWEDTTLYTVDTAQWTSLDRATVGIASAFGLTWDAAAAGDNTGTSLFDIEHSPFW